MVKKQVVFHKLPDWRLSGRPDADQDTLLTVGTNAVEVSAFIEEVDSETEGPVTTADVVKALGQIWEQVREATLAELRVSRKAIKKPRLG